MESFCLHLQRGRPKRSNSFAFGGLDAVLVFEPAPA